MAEADSAGVIVIAQGFMLAAMVAHGRASLLKKTVTARNTSARKVFGQFKLRR